MNKEGDALAADDAAQVIVPPPKSQAVLLVTDGNPYLDKLIHSLDLKAPDVIRPAAYEAKVPTEYDVVIFDNYKPPKLPEAGNFVWFGQVPDGGKTKIAYKDGQPVVIEDVRVLDWKRDHPILKDVAMGALYVDKMLRLQVPLDQEVLVDGLKGPLVVLEREGKRTHLIVSFDTLQSNWPLKQSFPVFMFNALKFLAAGSAADVQQGYRPGATPHVPRTNLLQAGPDVKKVTLHAPDGGTKELTVPAREEFVLPPLERVGVYTTDPPVPGFERIAVNLLDPAESNLVPAENIPGGSAAAEEGGSGKRRVELWWWLAVGGLGMLMVEWWVYTRRVHL